jgi:endonuclease YncB( thermonuclease family)
VVGFLLENILPIIAGQFLLPTITMKNIITRYKALSAKYQIGIALAIFIIALIALPNVIVYAAGAFVAYKLIDKKVWKYTVTGALCVITFFSAILLISGNTTPTQVADNVVATQAQNQNNVVPNPIDSATTTPNTPAPAVTQTKTETPAVKTQTTTAQPPSQYTYYSVTEVVDGDTIKISMNGKTETLRLIGMDTPETVDPRKPVQCFGKEASNKAKELLSGKKVRIETDPTQGERDKYERLLAYVYRDDGIFYNKYMIEQGYAHEYTYNTPYKYQAEFKAAQKSAQTAQLGLWSPNTCNGDTTSSNTSTQTQTNSPATTQSSGGKYYTSSHYSSKYWYPEVCDGWKSLSPSYLKSYATLEALLAVYPSKTESPQCQ